MRVHENVHATFVTSLLLFFGMFLCQLLVILKPFLTENEKIGGRTAERYQPGATFLFYSFSSILARKSSKMDKMCLKMVEI